MATLPWPDWVGLGVFLALYFGYAPACRALLPRSINARLGGLRVHWMRTMLRRDNRIVDSALLGQVMQSASFFASASLILIGAMLSLLSGVDRLQPALESLVLVAPVPRLVFELKVALPLAVMVHGFVRFTWAIRQLNYTIAFLGAAPDRHGLGRHGERLAVSIAAVMSSALGTYNAGLRCYYFALAGLAWVIGPFVLAAAALLLTTMLVLRQIAGPAASSFGAALAAIESAHADIGEL